ncbi:MerR family transcriptional regulator [Caldalkalibacillus salinus]|uniref:MerR family transcriptional regulator n=1 Tax=Caldalkalibacillus salinus TaxID=2803787 RepID=UPI001920ACD0|nr:MerR family transcriptional regulator [Caldalkalibacillus salinus]
MRAYGGVIIENHAWKVGELAELTGLSIRTLRYYDQIGLLTPSGHTEAGHRLYNEKDIARLQQIQALKELGLTLGKVKLILLNEQIDPLEVVLMQMERIKANLDKQQRLLKELENVSKLMQSGSSLTIEDFTRLLQLMRENHNQYFANRQKEIEHRLHRLGNFIISSSENKNEEDDT